jgi:hypothetical protein
VDALLFQGEIERDLIASQTREEEEEEERDLFSDESTTITHNQEM